MNRDSDNFGIRMPRRRFLRGTAGAAATAALGAVERPARATEPDSPGSPALIAKIERSIVRKGRGGADDGRTWFHPRACMVPRAGDGPARAVMTLQSITGSDVFGHVHVCTSDDLGRTWTDPVPIEGLGRRDTGVDRQEGTCDVVPQYHPPTRTVLAMGHNVYYRRGVLAHPQGPRHPVYVTRDANGDWSAPSRLEWNDPRGKRIHTCGCSQRLVLADGRLLVPLSFGDEKRRDRSVTTAVCSFDGREVAVERIGGELANRASRGLLEPSLAQFDGRFFITIRAEDGRGYVSVSDDGLAWRPQRAWAWDDGTALNMSTTQQHWITHSDGLFLVYTRKDASNVNVFRWRAPLFVARVDPGKLCLMRHSEQVALPLVGDGVADAKHVARMGNFHTTAASPDESWITVGETLPHDRWEGDLLMARLRWSRPNRSAVLGTA